MTDIIKHTERSQALIELVEKAKSVPNLTTVMATVTTCNGISKTLTPLSAISSQSPRLGMVYAASSIRHI